MKTIIQHRKITAKNLSVKLKKLPVGEAWTYTASKLSNEVYHGTKGSISSSMIKDMANEDVSDNYIKLKHIDKSLEVESTKPFLVGRATHTAILEKKLFDSEYAVFKGKTRRGKDYDAFCELNKGKDILSIKEYELVMDIRSAVMKNETARALFKNGKAEQSIFHRDEVTGLICKARADYLGVGYIADLKTMDDVCPRNFMSQVVRYGYHIQAAHYMEAFDVKEFAFVCVGKKAPYEVAIYTLDEELLEIGYLQRNQALEKFAELKESGIYKGFNCEKNPILELSAPSWFAKKHLGA